MQSPKEIILKQLEIFNDPLFRYEPKYHKYAYDGVPFKPVTKFIEQFHEPFKQDFWSKEKAEEEGISQEEMLKRWKDKNDYANLIGSVTHQWIEDYFNQIYQPLPDNLDVIHRINKFNTIYAKQLCKLEPLIFEVKVFSKKWKIAGTIDSLFLFRGKIYIIDWKTNGEYRDDDHPKGHFEKLLHPFEEFFKNHMNEYSIQVSLYASILEDAGFEVGGAYIVHIGPDEEPAKIHKVIDMREKLKMYLDGQAQ